jgi:hypothetical protein
MSAGKHLRPTRGPATKPPRPLSPVAYAQPPDLEDLVWFLRSVRDEIDGGRVEDDMMVALVERLVRREGGVAMIVRGQYGVEASLGVRFDHPELSRAHYLRAVWNVVAPEARKSTGHARSMLLHARAFADSIGLPLLIEEYSPDLEAGKLRLIGRHMKTAGAVFLHEPQPAEAI